MLQIHPANLSESAKLAANALSEVEARFAAQISIAVWFGKLTDTTASEALQSYAFACHPDRRTLSTELRDALIAEYRRARERQDLVS